MIDLLSTVEELPVSARNELYDYAEYLHKKFSREKKSKSFKLNWVGDLKELAANYNGVELQHEILNMWTK